MSYAAVEDPAAFPVWAMVAIAGACVAAVVYLAYAIHHYGGRERALRRLAAHEGLVYSAADPAGIGAMQFPSFARSKGVRVTNVLWAAGSDEASRARVFDYALYDERTRERSQRDGLQAVADGAFGFERRGAPDVTRTYSASGTGAIVPVDAFLPPCTITPASWVTRTFETMGLADLDFESDEFNRGWDVRCGDHRFANLFVDAQLIDLVLSLETKVALETFGNYVLFTTTRLARPAQVSRLLRAATSLPALLSPLVAEEYPTAAAMEVRSSMDAWQGRPDGRGGFY